jgi:hypothetical protein
MATPPQPVPDPGWKAWEPWKWLEDLIKYVTTRPDAKPAP